MLSKSLIQFSVDGWGSLFDLRTNCGGGSEDMTTSFKRSHALDATLSAPDPAAGHCCHKLPPETSGHSKTSLGQSIVESLLLFPASWCSQGFVCALQ